MVENINGILKVSNDNKELIVKLEDIIDIPTNLLNLKIKIIDPTSTGSYYDSRLTYIRINGKLLKDSEFIIAKYSNLDSYILTISVDSNYGFGNKDYNMFNLHIFIDDVETYIIPLYITKNTINQYKVYDKSSQMIASNMESFMLLRTNPKLTGNVKLVVDEDYNLYLDTFKISSNSVLNKQEYRHQAISADGNYPYDVYRIFKFLPATEMYGIYPDSYNPHISYHKMDDQIRNIYEYGAEYNSDKLYSENMKILAPLYIGKHLPDYFAIWRSERLETDDNTITNSDVFKQLLNDAKCIKIFDLRRSTTIGKYLNTYQEMIIKYLAGTCALQFIEQDNDKNSVDHRQGQNTWKGLAYDKGILTDRNETTYFATQTLEGSAPQENFDMFLVNGFSRNNLLFPNIINLEYMFNDKEVDDFSMHNYFGLYLTENDFITFNQVIKDENNANNYNLKYFDTSSNLIDINTTPIDVIEDTEFTDRIFFASTKNAVANLQSLDDLNIFTKNEAVNKPNENIVQLDGDKFKLAEDEKAFLSMDFTQQIKYGEHFKFIIPKYEYDNDKSKCVVFEIIASNDHRLKDMDNYISPYVQTNIPTRLSPIEKEEQTEIYRVAFYTQDLDNENESASLKDQILRIGSAIKKFDNVLKVGSDGEESISIISSVKDVYFQHIMSNEFVEERDSYSGEIDLNNIEVYDTLRYYNYNNIQKCEYIEYNNIFYDIHYIGYANNGLEETLERYANITKFINVDDFKDKYIYEIEKDLYDETHMIAYPLIYTVNGYYPMVKFSNNNGDLEFYRQYVSRFSLNAAEFISIISPYHVDKSIICSPYEIEKVNDAINICSPLELNVALMGINDVKDIDVYVNNEVIEEHHTEASSSFKAGEIVKLDNSDSRIRKFITYSIISGSIYGIPSAALNSFTILNDKIVYTNADNAGQIESINLTTDYIEFSEDTIIMLVSTNSMDLYNYDVTYPVLNEDNYYTDPIHTDKSDLTIPLVPHINCQWKSNGYYFDTLSLLDVNTLINDYDIVGNFIECKYTPQQGGQYIVDSLDDIINVNGEETTIYDYLLKTGTIKKYLCSNSKIQTAIGYYNPYVQTLEFIFYGIKFIFKLTSNEYANEIKLNEFDNYEVFIINDYNNTDYNEIIISKREEFILIINHTYKSTYYYGNSNIKTYKDNIIQDIDYDWFKSPYAYELKNTGYLNNKIYANKSISYVMNDLENLKSFIEIDLNIYDSEYTNFGEEPRYAYFTIDSNFKTYDNYDVYAYNNFNMAKDSSIENDITLLGTYYENIDADFRQKNGYVIKRNDTPMDELISTTYNDKLNAYIDSFKSDFNMYIIESDVEENIQPIKINENYKPLTIELLLPNKVKFNNGLFNPNFVNIFNFELNDNISDRIGIDTLYGNTQISSISSIMNYYSNKVLANSYEKTIGTFSSQSYSKAIGTFSKLNPTYVYNYFVENYRSPFSTNWDNNVYRQYTAEETYEYLQGYSLGVDDKMFFGSKVLNLHNNGVLLTKWDYNKNINNAKYNISKQNERSKQKKVLEIQLNLTKTFYDYLMNQQNFIDNWKNIKNYTNSKIYINNYINNVLYNLYNFKGNFDVTLYKKYDELIRNKIAKEHFIYDEPELQNFEIDQNYKTEFKDINNEVILTITVSNYENYIFYPTVKINKI